MKVTFQQNKEFRPLTLNLVLESQEEVDAIYSVFNTVRFTRALAKNHPSLKDLSISLRTSLTDSVINSAVNLPEFGESLCEE